MALPRKRKAPPAPDSDSASPRDRDRGRKAQDARHLLRRHFEARFQPLDQDQTQQAQRTRRDERDPDPDSDSDPQGWAGLSDAESDDDDDDGSDDESADEKKEPGLPIEIVDHSNPQQHLSAQQALTRRQRKEFMSSRPPSSQTTTTAQPQRPSSSTPTLPEDAPSLLKQDLQLRRLLAESHLLTPHHPSSKSLSSVSLSSSSSSSSPKSSSFAEGRTRTKTTDLRLQALGAKVSILTQDKMPMHMRKGINAAASAREVKRRREARENGIILERETGKKKSRRRARDGGGVDRPGVGRLRGAELRISERDVRGIEGMRDAFGRRGSRR